MDMTAARHTEPNGLTARLKQATRALHTRAERSGVMVELLQGRIGLAPYCALLRNLHAIYAALESALDAHGADDAGAPLRRLWPPALRRLPHLERDLQHLHTGDWRAAYPLVPAADVYVERIRALSHSAPELLPAHAYVRYLGDLFGGQALARLVRGRFGLPGDDGTAFYRFGSKQEVEQLRHALRAGLDALVLGPAQDAAFVAEACSAFERHIHLFDELQARYPAD
jgi:heme oxygenase (biliverdin-producing, ferredoxin)